MKHLIKNNENPADAAIRWVDNIKALADVIGSFRGLEDETPDREGVLAYNSDKLGGIIEDYAEAIEDVLNEAYSPIRYFFYDGWDSPSAETERKLAWLQGVPVAHAYLEDINELSEKIARFQKEAIKMDVLSKKLAKLQEQYSKMEGASVQHNGRSEAPEKKDVRTSSSESTIGKPTSNVKECGLAA